MVAVSFELKRRRQLAEALRSVGILEEMSTIRTVPLEVRCVSSLGGESVLTGSGSGTVDGDAWVADDFLRPFGPSAAYICPTMAL